MNKHLKNINCPVCGKNDTWKADNQSRPFCSSRCKLIDLGDWASEKNRIPAEKADFSDEEPPETE